MSIFNLMAIGENITSESPIGERLSTGLLVALIGMAVVFGVLLILMAILYVFKLVFAKKGAAEAQASAAPVSAPAVSSGDPDEETAAVISAAVAAMYGKSDAAYKIKSIKKIVG